MTPQQTMTPATLEQKPWQHGYKLDYLKRLEDKYFARTNALISSPFLQFKKNKIAAALHEQTLKPINGLGYVNVQTAKVATDIVMYYDIVIGKKLRGDYVITNVVCLPGEERPVGVFLDNAARSLSTWLFILEEDESQRKIAEYAGFSKVGVKINTFADIIGVYFRDADNSLVPRAHPAIDPYEKYAVQEVDLAVCFALDGIQKNLSETQISFENHYSNYNKGDAWGAISLRGYSDDPFMIAKPSEMNDKWKAANPEMMNAELRDTPLFEKFPSVRTLMDLIPGNKHRIRFMRLKPGGGELQRHTDQVDPDAGVTHGKLMRLHIPIKTNPDVRFTLWDYNGQPKVVNMKVGECWYLDTRKPHQAGNFGTEERIHLVVDVEASDCLKKMICSS